MPGFSDWLFGSSDKLKKVPTGTKEQEALHNNILAQAMGMSGAGGGYNQAQQYYNSLLQPGNEAFQNFASPFMNQFEEQILPQIAERFAGAGALSSSGFGQALGGAGAGLQSQLAQLFAQLQSQAAGAQTNQFNQLSQTGLNYQPFAYQQQQGSSGFLGPLLGGIGTAMGGPIGAALGQGIGGGISSLFKKSSPGIGGGIGGQAGNAAQLAGLMGLMG
jgi:hypothetical protein